MQPKKWGTKPEICSKCKDQKCIYFGQNIIKKKKKTMEKVDGVFKGTYSEYLYIYIYI